ncbi:aspartate aminotransferase AspT [Striga asiatica]|uniref:Aspartate aminotransferase AspT n=1 Tax=Striga asiatica TaxID=4170 RepID=A0A5A7NX76_STRAF|nr:aspartate aminotransferase AspT [Striga asiatica]
MKIEDKNKLLTCRMMMGRECKVTPKVMKDVFGFTSVSAKKKPIDYLKMAPMDWKVISGSDKFTSNGAPFFLAKDVALGFFGKFIAYQVSGKDQATRLNQHELFIMKCAMDKQKRINVIEFIWASLADIQVHEWYHPSFGTFVTALAMHFQILNPARLRIQTVTRAKIIDKEELTCCEFIDKNFALNPHKKRPKVERFFKENIAKGKSLDTQQIGDTEQDAEAHDEDGADTNGSQSFFFGEASSERVRCQYHATEEFQESTSFTVTSP